MPVDSTMESHPSLPPPLQTNELPIRFMNPKIDALLSKSIALQLKLLLKDSNIEFTQQSFNELMVLVKYQMNDLMKNLNKIMLLQRRLAVSNEDIEMWLQGYKLNVNDLFENIQLNQFLRQERLGDEEDPNLLLEGDNTNNDEQPSMSDMDKMLKEQLLINKNLNLISNISSDNNQRMPTSSTQSHLQNPIFNCNIKLPELPPDHTYKFTSQFNNFTTDERIIKQNLVDESKITESTLLNYLNTIEMDETEPQEAQTNNKHSRDHVDDKEMLALFGTRSHPKPFIHHDFNFYYNKKSFNIAKYSHHRIDIARKRVKDFEINHIMNTKNPIFNLIYELRENEKKFDESTHNNNNLDNPLTSDFKIETSFNNKKINSLLKRDLSNFLSSRTHLQKKKKHVIEKAIKDRDIRINEIRQEIVEREKREKEAKTLALLKNQQLANAAVLEKVKSTTPQILIPQPAPPSIIPTEIIVGANTGDDDDDEMGLFGGLESSDEESAINTTAAITTVPAVGPAPHVSPVTSQVVLEEIETSIISASKVDLVETQVIVPPNNLPTSVNVVTNATDVSVLSDATVPSSVDHTMTQAPVLLTRDESIREIEETNVSVSTPKPISTTQEIQGETPSEMASTPIVENSNDSNPPPSTSD